MGAGRYANEVSATPDVRQPTALDLASNQDAFGFRQHCRWLPDVCSRARSACVPKCDRPRRIIQGEQLGAVD